MEFTADHAKALEKGKGKTWVSSSGNVRGVLSNFDVYAQTVTIDIEGSTAQSVMHPGKFLAGWHCAPPAVEAAPALVPKKKKS